MIWVVGDFIPHCHSVCGKIQNPHDFLPSARQKPRMARGLQQLPHISFAGYLQDKDYLHLTIPGVFQYDLMQSFSVTKSPLYGLRRGLLKRYSKLVSNFKGAS